MEFRDVAKYYKSKGLSTIPINADKTPRFKWYNFCSQIATNAEIDEMFNSNTQGIGIVTGKVSCPTEGYSLLVVDIDAKNFDSNITYEDIVKSVPKEIFEKLFIVRTRSGGFHWYIYTPAEITGNKKYAMRLTSEQERMVNPDEKVVVLIENRAEGGFVVAPPTQDYTVVSEVKKIPYITLDEHNTIVDAVCSFNRVYNDEICLERFVEERKNKFLINPFSDYDNRCDLLGLLNEYGYTEVKGSSKNDEVRIKRPGATSSHSGYLSLSNNRYTNFSTSGFFEGGKSYRPSEVLCLLEFGNNWKQCYRYLIDNGYGIGIDYSSEVNNLVELVKQGNTDEILKYVFEAEKVSQGIYRVNNQIVKIK